MFLALAKRDVRDPCDLLRSTWERTAHLDGQVSLEVDPGLTYDRDATIAEGRHLHELVDRQNLYVKIPATEPGLGAIGATIASGIAVADAPQMCRASRASSSEADHVSCHFRSGSPPAGGAVIGGRVTGRRHCSRRMACLDPTDQP